MSSQNLDEEIVLKFFNIEEFYQSCNIDCTWWICFDIWPIDIWPIDELCIPNFLFDLEEYFRFSPTNIYVTKKLNKTAMY